MQKIITHAKEDSDVLAVILFGSAARGEPHRDIDIAIALFPSLDKKQRGSKVLEYAFYSDNGYDVHVFQALPLAIRKEILRDGNVLLCKDEDVLFDIAVDVIREWRTFEPHYEQYLEVLRDDA